MNDDITIEKWVELLEEVANQLSDQTKEKGKEE